MKCDEIVPFQKALVPPGRRNVMQLIFLVPSFLRLTTSIVSCSNTSDVPRLTLGVERAEFLRCQVLESIRMRKVDSVLTSCEADLIVACTVCISADAGIERRF
jgi:hypothetical protein